MKAAVAGAGPVGLATAMMLAREGWDVKVLEKDPQEPFETAGELWESWQRPDVAQFRQPRFMMPRFRHVLDSELPAVRDRLERLGGRRFSLVDLLPPTVTDRSPRSDDARFETLTARRPVLEAAFAQAARSTPGVEVIRGAGVQELVARDRGRIPHVTGVRTSGGERLEADLVIDAMGRRSKLPEWIAALGGRPPHEEAADAGFAYYSRNFRSRDGQVPQHLGPLGSPLGTFHALTILGDNNCWTVALVPVAGDAPLKALRHAEVWERVARAIPHVAHWLDGEPLTDVVAMAGVLDRYRRFVVDRDPVVAGVVAVGDSWACTNPTASRGLSLGLMHAVALRDVLRETASDPCWTALRFDEVTESTIAPWYRDQVGRDHQRGVQMRALIEGEPPSPPSDPLAQMQAAFLAGAARDPEIARAWFEVLGCLALPREVQTRPGMAERVMGFLGAHPSHPPAPTRAELLSLVGG
jgi:2-polyprenyl-6-methoxyphenol hydroxylase-like FAD-dependent oxidoreductase